MKTYNNFIKENKSDINVISKYFHINELTIHFDFMTQSNINLYYELIYFYKDKNNNDKIIFTFEKNQNKIWLCDDIIHSISEELDAGLFYSQDLVNDFFQNYFKNSKMRTYDKSFEIKMEEFFGLFDNYHRQYESKKNKKIELSEEEYAKLFLETIYYDTLKIVFNLLDYPSSVFYTSDKFIEDDYYDYSWICEISHDEIYKEFVLNSPIFDILNRQYIDSDYSLRYFLSKYTKFGDLPVVWSAKEVYL